MIFVNVYSHTYIPFPQFKLSQVMTIPTLKRRKRFSMAHSSFQLHNQTRYFDCNKVFYPNFTDKVQIDTIHVSIWGENTHHVKSYSTNITERITNTIKNWLAIIPYTSTCTGSYHLFYFNLTSFNIYSHIQLYIALCQLSMRLH